MRIMSSAPQKVIGLMSGTSMDGIDVAVLETDGALHNKLLYSRTYEYRADIKARLKKALGNRNLDENKKHDLEDAITRDHAKVCEEALALFDDIKLIGFHGQTIWHAPQDGKTCQLGDGNLLAHLTGCQVIYDFRSADMKAGGQGAPLLPIYHHKRAVESDKPLAVLNIGGVSNITYIDQDVKDIIGFDCGTGNALLNDWVTYKTGEIMDADGRYASAGKIDHEWVNTQMGLDYFNLKPPKSLDRDAFNFDDKKEKWSLNDGAATLTYFTAQSIKRSCEHLPSLPKTLAVTGGGRRNPVLMNYIQDLLPDTNVMAVEELGWNGDALEAEGFAHFAMCYINKTPITYPNITGCNAPVIGGQSS